MTRVTVTDMVSSQLTLPAWWLSHNKTKILTDFDCPVYLISAFTQTIFSFWNFSLVDRKKFNLAFLLERRNQSIELAQQKTSRIYSRNSKICVFFLSAEKYVYSFFFYLYYRNYEMKCFIEIDIKKMKKNTSRNN